MNCPKCGRKVSSDDINIRHMAANCRSCAEVFSFAAQFPAAEGPGTGGGFLDSPERPAPPRPPGLAIMEAGGRLTMSFSWRTGALFMLIPFTIAWNGFLVFWYSAALGTPSMPTGAQLLMLIFPVAHVAAGLFLLHGCLTGLFNSTTVTVDRNTLNIRHGPIPAGGNLTIPTAELDQLFCRSNTSTDSDGDTQRNFSLHAVLRNGSRQYLLVGQADRDILRYLEFLIERHLGIVDRPVE
jgi:hypothetical protein